MKNKLTIFLVDNRLEMNNNVSDRKPFVIGIRTGY
jgi:hypothetical protein